MIKIIPYIIAFYSKLVDYTSRRVEIHPERLDEAKAMSEYGNVALSCWHQNLFTGMVIAPKPIISMASNSKDGYIAARYGELIGIDFARGSSSRGGMNAAVQMIRYIKKTRNTCAITPDGPKGPAKVPKAGILKIANKCGIPVLPIIAISSRHHEFKNNWDNFRLPLPFGTIYIGYGQPFMIEHLDDASMEAYAQQLAKDSQRVEEEVLDRIYKKTGKKS